MTASNQSLSSSSSSEAQAPAEARSQTDTPTTSGSTASSKRSLLASVDSQVSSYFIAGGIAGAASRTVVSPLERLKIIQYASPCHFFSPPSLYSFFQASSTEVRTRAVPRRMGKSCSNVERRRVQGVYEGKWHQLFKDCTL